MQKHITNIHVTLTFPLHFLNQLPSTEFTSSNHLSWAAVCFFFCNNPVKGSAIANRDVLVSFVRFWRVVEWFVFQQLSIETCCTRLWAFCDLFQCLKLSIRKKLFDIKDCMEVTEHPFCIYLTTNECSRYQKYQEMGWNHSIYSIMSDIGAALQMPFFFCGYWFKQLRVTWVTSYEAMKYFRHVVLWLSFSWTTKAKLPCEHHPSAKYVLWSNHWSHILIQPR